MPHAPARPAMLGKSDAMRLPSVSPVSDALYNEELGMLTHIQALTAPHFKLNARSQHRKGRRPQVEAGTPTGA